MNIEKRTTIKSLNVHDSQIPLVIKSSIGNPSPNKIMEVIKSYNHPDHAIIGAFRGDILIGILGICKTHTLITIRHISVLRDFQKKGIGTLLLNEIKKHYAGSRIIAETDAESVGFYAKSGFSYHEFKGQHGNLRYKCEFDI